MREVDRLGDGVVRILLESRLHPDMPYGRDIVRRDEYPLYILRHFVYVVERALLSDLLHQLFGIETAFSRYILE